MFPLVERHFLEIRESCPNSPLENLVITNAQFVNCGKNHRLCVKYIFSRFGILINLLLKLEREHSGSFERKGYHTVWVL